MTRKNGLTLALFLRDIRARSVLRFPLSRLVGWPICGPKPSTKTCIFQKMRSPRSAKRHAVLFLLIEETFKFIKSKCLCSWYGCKFRDKVDQQCMRDDQVLTRRLRTRLIFWVFSRQVNYNFNKILGKL